ncbi:MAG: hypothetical protein ACREAN_00275, partial [Nitrosopumilaceae archaeon]
FPQLEKKDMPKESGPIAVMLMEHHMTPKACNKNGRIIHDLHKDRGSIQLVIDMHEYINM